MDDTVRRLIADMAQRRGDSLAALSKQLGKNHAYLQQFIRRGIPAELPERVRGRLARLLEIDEERLRGPDDAPSGEPLGGNPRGIGATSRPGPRPRPDYLGEPDLKVFAATEGGGGAMVVSTDPIEIVPRPWYLKSVKDGFAVLVVGESMIEAFYPGDMAIVNPKLPPRRDRNVILVSEEDQGGFTAMIKHLVGWTEKEWRVRQFNPRKEFTLSRREWPKALRVVGKYDGG